MVMPKDEGFLEKKQMQRICYKYRNSGYFEAHAETKDCSYRMASSSTSQKKNPKTWTSVCFILKLTRTVESFRQILSMVICGISITAFQFPIQITLMGNEENESKIQFTIFDLIMCLEKYC